MDKSAFMGALIGSFAFNYLSAFFKAFYNHFICEDDESFWENHQFEDPLEEADNLCQIGHTLQRNEINYKKISEKSGLLKY